MWVFAVVCCAICTPAIRAMLEALFAELTVIFVNSMSLVAIAVCAGFIGALMVQLCALTAEQQQQQQVKEPRVSKVPTAPLMTMTRATRGASSTGKRANGSAISAWRSLMLTAVVLPMGVTLAAEASGESRRLTDSSVPAKYNLANNVTSYAYLLSDLERCKYSGGDDCLNNPTSIASLGEYKRGPGQCAAFDSVHVNVTSAIAAQPNRYLPIGVMEAHEAGFENQFSQWSEGNQAQFKLDCPILYEETVAQGQDYLCCTQSQYEGLQTQVSAIPGLCTSCKENLRNVFCQMTCSPNNSMFIEVVQVRLMPGDAEHADQVYPAIEELNYFVGADWIRDIYDFCEADDSFSFLCSPSQNCTDGYGLLDFMGEYKFDNLGSPLQINVKTMDNYPPKERKEMFCECGAKDDTDCFTPTNGRLRTCVDVCGSLCAVSADDHRSYTEACFNESLVGTGGNGGDSTSPASDGSSGFVVADDWKELMAYMAANLTQSDFGTLDIVLAVVGGVLAAVVILCFLLASCRRRKYAAAGSNGINPGAAAGVFGGLSNQGDERRLSWVDDAMTSMLKKWGFFAASGSRPYAVIAIAMVVVVACSVGLINIEVETDPVRLWTAESSRPYKERDRYADLFMPFYRTEQVLMVPKDGGIIGRKEYLREAIALQEKIAAVTYGPKDAEYPERVTLEDICWKATGTACTVNSITQYFQNNLEHFDFYDKYGLAMDHFKQCMYSPSNADIQTCATLAKALDEGDKIPDAINDCPCLSAFGSPMNLYNTYLGGFPDSAVEDTTQYINSKALVSTALAYNYYNDDDNKPAVQWEREFIELLKTLSEENDLFDLFFQAETSIQDEIEKESSGDMLPVILSYSLMIVYVSLGINRWSFRKSFFQTSKISVGFLGVVCIMFAVSTTIGIFMWCGVKLQLIIMEVVPFLTLAIGVDNIFLIVHAVDDKQELLRREQPRLFENLEDPAVRKHTTAVILSEALAYIGPSIFMASFAEAVAFTFGCISPMPVVLWFAAFATVAVIINLVLQMTLLLSIITLDKRRELSGKYDILCCMRATSGAPVALASGTPPGIPNPMTDVKTPEDGAASTSLVGGSTPDAGTHLFDRCIDAYAAVLANTLVKLIVVLFFLACTLLSIHSIENIDHGLPQAESMPSDSYMTSYFNALDEYLATGPPIFFVVEGGYGRNPPTFNLNDQSVGAKFCRSKSFCDKYSVPSIVDALGNKLNTNISHFAPGITYSWMDDFWGFVNPDSECCRIDQNDAYIPIDAENRTFTAERKKNPSCLSTPAPPVPDESFMSLFSMFSTASAGSMCSYGGGSIYRGQFSVDDDPIPIVTNDLPQVVLNTQGYGKHVSAFSYMTFATANPTQRSFIDSYAQARRAAQWISDKTGVDVWAYSITFVFFDQYLTVIEDTYKLVGLAIVAIFLIHVVYFGGIFYPLVVTLSVINIVIYVMGLMQPNDILLNGLSMVNLIIAAGVSVEFCGHFVRMFAKAHGSGDERARTALRKVLTSVLFGITITKVVGLSALTLADSRIFQKYYFRMYMTIVVCGVLTGMVLLPVVLSICVDVRDHYQGNTHRRPEPEVIDDGMESPAYRGAATGKPSMVSESTSRSASD